MSNQVPGVTPQYEAPLDGFSLAAFILGLTGFNVLAIIFGAVGLSRTKDGIRTGRWMAITGIVLGAFFFIVLIGLVILAVVFGIADY